MTTPPDIAQPSAPRVAVRGLSKSFDAVRALANVSLSVAAGEIRAICGENGAGKSTLVKLLTGVLRPDAGEILIDGTARAIGSPKAAQAAGLALVAQELSLVPDLSVEDNIWLGTLGVPLFHKRGALRARARDALDRVGAGHIALEARLATLGMGERQLVEIARMLTREARVLILDEPTATLSDTEIAHIFAALRALKRDGRTILYITHRLSEVFAICDSASVLRNGELVATRQVSVLDRQSLIALMLGRSFAEMYPEPNEVDADIVLDVVGLFVPGRVAPLSFQVGKGKIVCVVGQVGSGAVEVIDALAGLVHDAQGRIVLDGAPMRTGSTARATAAGIAFVSGDRAAEGLFQDLSIYDNLVATRLSQHTHWGLLDRGALRRVAERLAGQVGLDATRLDEAVDRLSGGNQQKIAFARCIGRKGGRVLLMNEPTRGIDVGARADIYRLMRAFCAEGYGMVMTSSDLEEALGIADTVITLYRGRRVGTYARGATNMARIVADITHPAGAA